MEVAQEGMEVQEEAALFYLKCRNEGSRASVIVVSEPYGLIIECFFLHPYIL